MLEIELCDLLHVKKHVLVLLKDSLLSVCLSLFPPPPTPHWWDPWEIWKPWHGLAVVLFLLCPSKTSPGKSAPGGKVMTLLVQMA